ncbi:MAG: cyclodeaminase/cyclohydrolase family protein [bacterium]
MNNEILLNEYFEQLSSSSPTPGGGNVSALCGGLASALGEMVCNLTIGKKKYLEFENDLIGYKEKLIDYKNQFLDLADADNEAFNKVMAAFKLPKETDEQKSVKNKAIEEATIGAVEVPFKVINLALKTVDFLESVSVKGNKNSISDVGVAVLLIQTAAKGAYLNVIINCSSLKGNVYTDKIASDAAKIVEMIEKTTNKIFENIKNGLING